MKTKYLTTRNYLGLRALVISGFAIVFLCFASTIGQAQLPPSPEHGFQPAGSYALSNIESINTANGNMTVTIPLASLAPGRGGSPGFQLSLTHNSKLYDTHIEELPDPVTGELTPYIFLNPSEQGGWHYNVSPYELQLISRLNVEGSVPCGCTTEVFKNAYIWKLKVIFPDSGEHEFRPLGYTDYFADGYYNVDPNGRVYNYSVCGVGGQDCAYSEYQGTTSGMTYYSTDGTFMRLDIPYSPSGGLSNNWTLSFPDGRRVVNTNGVQRVYDRNNNYTEFQFVTYNGHLATKIVDELGRFIILEYDPAAARDYIHVTGTNGEQAIWTVKWKTIYAYKPYRASASTTQHGNPYPTTGSNTPLVVDQIILPSQAGSLAYTFAYNAPGTDPYPNYSYGWGEISSITLPSSAQATYAWTFDGPGVPQSPLGEWVLQAAVTSKNLQYNAEYDGATTPITDTWTYSAPMNYGGVMTITGPDGGVTRNYSDYTGPFARVAYKTENPDGSVIERIWQQNIPYQNPPMNSAVNPYVKTEFASIKDAAGNLSLTSIKDYDYDKNGNVTQVKEYDWVAYASAHPGGGGPVIPAGAQPKRITVSAFFNPTPVASDNSYNGNVYNQLSAPQTRNIIASGEVQDAAQPFSRTEFFYDNPSTTANLTQTKTWDSTKGAFGNPLTTSNSISVSTQYNVYGSPILTTDARGFQTQLFYGNVGGVSDLYPTQIKTAYNTSVQRTETREYDFNTGLVTRVTDFDNNVSTVTTYDVFGRPTLVRAAENKPEETRARTYYSDVDRRVIVKSDLNTVGDEKLVTIKHYDQLGRVRLARQLEDAATQSATDETTGIKAQTRYLFSGTNSYVLTSNPYRATTSGAAGSETTMGWTRSKSDNGGRVVEVQTFGGAGLPAPWGANTTGTGTVTTAYDANFTTVTDQAGRVRRSMSNGLGQLTRVDEPDSNGNLGATDNPNQPTSYTYDARTNLITVNQGSQTRSFTYSSLSRLLTATNPESGTISYSYDDNGNLLSKTDARGIVSSYVYDPLNRVTSRSYSDGTPTVIYTYDSTSITNGKGRLASVSSSVSAYSYSGYDALGRALGGTQTIGSQNYSISNIIYDRAGHVTSMTYPSGHTVNYNYDPAGRLADKDAQNLAFTGNLGDGVTRTYSAGIIYSPFGEMTKEQFGTTTTPIFNKHFYNSRGQLSEIRAGTTYTGANDTGWERGAIINHYSDSCWGMCSGLPMTDNNGNVKKQEHWIQDGNGNVTGIFTQQYAYDALNRLQRVYDGANWQQQYVYDRWGNRTIDQANTWGAGIPKPNFNVDPNTNRLGVPSGQSGAMSYDSAGNLTTDTYSGTAVTRIYDAENKMTSETTYNSVVSGSYSYDADGRRVKRVVGSTETWQVYGIGGELLAEYTSNGTQLSKEYGYRNGKLLITATVTTGWGAAPTFTDNPLNPPNSPPTEMKLVHLTELRSAVNALRSHAGLPPFNFTVDPNPQQNVTTVKADHIRQLRTALEGARNALGLSIGGYAHPTLTENFSLIYAVDFQELRGQILDAWQSGGGPDIRWLVSDQLGTPRMIFDQTGSLANVSRHDYLPFGEELFAGTGGRTSAQGYTLSDNLRQKFTLKERDNETGLDFFEARYYASTQGRFTSVDPLMASGNPGSPQSWNRYAYCFNNPLRFTDPSGMLAGDFYDQEGKRLGTDGLNDGKAYVVTDQAQAKQIQQTDKNKGTTQVSAVSSAIELPGLDVRTAIGAAVDRSNNPTADDTKGGFHEEGLQSGTDANGQAQIVNAAPGAYSNPQVNTEATITLTTAANPAQQGILTTVAVSAHVHPKGEIKIEEGPKPQPGQVIFGGTIKTTTYNFIQPPSARDISNARPGTNIVVGARDKKVYIYDSSGTRATFPLNKFLSIGKK